MRCISFEEIAARCAADARCAGFANMSSGCGHPTNGRCGYRPVMSATSINALDSKWTTWRKRAFQPPPAPPHAPPTPPAPPMRSWQVWKKRLADGSVAVSFLNRGSRNQTITVKLSELGVAAREAMHARDLYLRKDLGPIPPGSSSYTVQLAGFASSAIKLTPSRQLARRPQRRVVCDDVPWHHSDIVQRWSHYLRTYAQLDCAVGEVVAGVRFASLGRPRGECGEQRTADPACHDGSSGAKAMAERLCLGRRSCRVESRELELAPAGCGDDGARAGARLAVEVECAAAAAAAAGDA
jgi:hypothetical protein